MNAYKYYGKVNGKTVKGPISASSMNSAIITVAKAYSLGTPNCETTAEVVHVVNGADFVEITTVGSTKKRAAKVECK
jgi:hypothetical protein